jgi:integrase
VFRKGANCVVDVNLADGTIRIERAWDLKAGEVEPKSAAGRRTVPMAAVLRDHLLEHRMSQKHTDGLMFGRSPDRPFNPTAVRARAARAWERARLKPIGLHECRHTYAALMIASGVNPKALSTYMGHSSIQITFDKYGALMPGNEEEAAELLDAYLERANTRARLAAVDPS